MKILSNSVTFINSSTAWFPAKARIIIPIIAATANLTTLPVSGGGPLLAFSALYKTKFSHSFVN